MPEPVVNTLSDVLNPFPGLRPFGPEESHLFFGRETQIEDVLVKLSHHRFVAVVGTSGSGKSSLVRAGILPILNGGYATPVGREWHIASIRPGTTPIQNLANALFTPEIFGTKEPGSQIRSAMAEAVMRGSSLGLVQVLREHLPFGKNILIHVDQFEELFRYGELHGSGTQAEGAAFVNLLVEAINQRDVPIYIMLTLRSDFLGDCAQFAGLPEAINDGQYLVPRLNRDQLKSAIQGPVTFARGKIAPRLVQQLLNDLGNDPDQLPVLQHALMRTWEVWRASAAQGEPMDFEHYRKIGGIEKALSLHADEAFMELPAGAKQTIAENIFKCLTIKEAENRGIRRPTTLANVAAICGVTEKEVIQVVEVFRREGREFIMPPFSVPLLGETVLDISHESLMRVWERLEKWVDEEREAAHLYSRITESALLYFKGSAGVWRDPELQLALDWQGKNNPTSAWAAQYNPDFDSSMRFLNASLRASDTERKEKKNRRLILNSIGGVFICCLGILSFWAMKQRNIAAKNAESALEQKLFAEKQEALARQKKTEAESNYKAAQTQTLLAERKQAEADRERENAQVQKMQAELQKSLAQKAYFTARSAQEAAEQEKQIAVLQKQIADRLKLQAEKSELNAKRLRLLSAGQNLAIRSNQLKEESGASLKGLFAYHAYDFFKENGGNMYDPDVYNAVYSARHFIGGKDNVLLQHNNEVKSLVSSPDGSAMVSAGSDGTVLLWRNHDEDSKPAVIIRHPSVFSCAALNSAGDRVAVGSDDNLILVNKTSAPPEEQVLLSGHVGKITGLAFIGDVLYSSALDFSIRVWDIKEKEESAKIKLNARPLCMAAFGEGILLAGCEDGTIYKINTAANTASVLLAHEQRVTSLAASADGMIFAAGLGDGGILLYDHKGTIQAALNSHSAAITSLSFGKKDALLASSSLDGKVKLWDLANRDNLPITLADHESWVWAVAYVPQWGVFLSGGRDKTVRHYNPDVNILAREVRGKLDRSLTKEEWTRYIGSDIPYESAIQNR